MHIRINNSEPVVSSLVPRDAMRALPNPSEGEDTTIDKGKKTAATKVEK